MPICSKLIFRRLLIKFNAECTFKFNNRFFKQVDGYTMGGPLFVTFSDIYMVNMENDVVIPSKPTFYPNINLTIKVNLSKFLDIKLANINGAYRFSAYQKNITTFIMDLQNSKTL